MNDEKTHAVINRKLIKKMGHIRDQHQEAQLAKSEIEHKRPLFLVFFILRYGMLRLLELNYIFSWIVVILTRVRRSKWIPIYYF